MELSKNFTKEERAFLRNLSTPSKIQDYLESIPFNHEEHGETCMSPRRVMREKKAHCLEGGMLAVAALLLNKKKASLISLKVVEEDYDHVVCLYKENGYFGAISKTNHAVLGFRDPVYKNVRELAMSYFHEYFLLKNGEKTMRGFSRAINMKQFGTYWMTEEDDLFSIALSISAMEHIEVAPKENIRNLRKATKLDRASATISRDGK